MSTLPADESYTIKLSGSGGMVFISFGSSLACTVKQDGTTVSSTESPGSGQQMIPEWVGGESISGNFTGKMVVLDTDANVRIAKEYLNSYVMTIEHGTVISPTSDTSAAELAF